MAGALKYVFLAVALFCYMQVRTRLQVTFDFDQFVIFFHISP